MNEPTHFNKVSSIQIFWVVFALSVAALIEASSDWLKSQNPPSLTIGSIAMDTIGFFLVGLAIGVPVTMLFWNRLVVPVFDVRKIRYVHGLIIVTVIYWFSGL